MKLPYIFFTLLLLSVCGYSQVGIGIAVPAASSEVDITSTTKGVLIPRVTLAEKNAIVLPANGLLVFQTDAISGLYFYDLPTTTWRAVATDGWALTGNTGTSPATNYVGTQDDTAFSIITGDIKRFTIMSSTPASSNGNIGIGTSNALDKVHIVGSGTPLLFEGFESNTLGSFTTGCTGASCVSWQVTNIAGQYNSGNFAARSGPLNTPLPGGSNLIANTTNFLEYTTTTLATGGKIAFDFRLNSEVGGDFFRFFIDGVQQGQWDGVITYNTVSYNLTAGSHVLRWQYSKNGNTNVPIDRVFIDNVLVSENSAAIRIKDGTEAANYILASDAIGNTSWINPQTLITGTNWSVTGNADPSGTATPTNFIGTTTNVKFNIGTNGSAKMVIQPNGNVGVNVANPISKLDVVADMDNFVIVRGQNLNTDNTKISYGVRGQANSTQLGSAGILGISANAANTEIGVFGDYNDSGNGVGVVGLGFGATVADIPLTPNIGVLGVVNSAIGTGVYGKNTYTNPPSVPTTPATAYGVYCQGNFATTTGKSASVPTTQGNQLVYCTESPEIWLEEMGFESLINGEAIVNLDELFLETIFIDESHKPHVFIQDQSETNGLIVTMNPDNKGFTVKEKKNGTSNGSFTYRILAKRRFYQDQRFGVDANQPFENNLIKAKKVPAKIKDINKMKIFIENTKKEELAKNTITE